MNRFIVTGVVAGALAVAGPATAAELLLGAYAHDVSWIGKVVGSGAADREYGSEDIEVGLRSGPITALRLIGSPQAHAFISLNTNRTSNFGALGLSWTLPVGQRFYVRPGIGLAHSDGKAGLLAVNAPGLSPAETSRRLRLYETRIDFGSQTLFEPEIGFGMKLGPRLAAELSWVHISNGEVFHHGKNQGLDDTGLRLAYAFGRAAR